MNDEYLTEACRPYRAAEQQEVAAIVLQDRDLRRVLAAWPTAPRAFLKRPIVPNPGWDDLWSAIYVDTSALIEMTGLHTGRAQVAYRRAIALRLIYPDGGVHATAKLVLKSLIKREFDTAGGRRR